ncbi:MAG: ribonuclease H [Lapillicoccus sp.]
MPFSAKYAGTCRVCNRPFGVGDLISTNPGSTAATGGYVHDGCAQGALELEGMPVAAEGPVAKKTAASKTAASKTAASGKVAARASRISDAVPEGTLEVWTDGACSGNPGPGGWAWATKDGREGSGGAAHTTNQRMEIQAALEAVTTLTERPIEVVSDSTYVVHCFHNGWYKGWLAKGWVNSAKKPVANRDLWEPLIAAYLEQGTISFRWVKGHSGDPMNDRVDELAVAAGKAHPR